METYFYVCGNGNCYRNIFWRRRWFTYYRTKKVKLEKEEKGHCIKNCFSMFFGKDSSEILSLLWNEFQENIHLYMGFSEYSSTEELIKSLEEYIFNKRYNHDSWLARSTIDVIMSWKEEIITYNLIVVNEKGCEKANKRLHNPYSRSILLFYILFCFIFTTALLKRCWFVFTFSWST